MNTERFDRLREVVMTALDLPEEDQEAFLTWECAGDDELREAARRLLRYDVGVTGLAAISEPEEARSAPEKLGRYRVLGELGAGGMGVVYLGVDPTLGREVALKVLPEWLAAHPSALGRFEKEARLLARLNHANIATIHSLERTDSHVFLTMEVVDGQSLAERLGEGPLPVDEALSVARELASAVEAAHDRGVVHRDLKPSNVMVGRDGVVKVLDFGLAQLATAEEEVGGTRPGTDEPRQRVGGEGTRWTGRAGTPGYMSPEQIRGQGTDGRTDIWSFGCLLYECLTGERAFGGSPYERMRATLEGEVDLDRVPEETPLGVRGLIRRCLSKDPEGRPASIREARQTLDREFESRASGRLRSRRGGPLGETNLPGYATRFFGREEEIAGLEELLAEERLVTLIGSGGVGKTRLAVELAARIVERYPEGIRFVDLTAIRQVETVSQELLDVAGLKEEPRREHVETLVDHLSGKRMLLVIDNCEHVLEACRPLVERLIGGCDELRILATSRRRIEAEGERLYLVAPLPVPGVGEVEVEEAVHHDGVRLYADRAAAADPHFALTVGNAGDVVEVCRVVEGLPLAIELAAARASTLTAAEIVERLRAHRLRILRRGGGGDTRHASLRAAIDWSYDRLTEGERAVFRRLSVFRGGWTLEAAERVCAGGEAEEWEILDLISGLIEKSMIEREVPGTVGDASRYRMLETLREYAAERLREAGEEREIVKHHVEYYFDFVERADIGPAWLKRLAADDENVRSALSGYREAGISGGRAALVAAGMFRLWLPRGHWREGQRCCRELVPSLSGTDPEELEGRARVLRLSGCFASHLGKLDQARAELEESLRIARALDLSGLVRRCLNNLGNLEREEGNVGLAIARFDEALADFPEGHDPQVRFSLLFNRATMYYIQGRLDAAEEEYHSALDLADSFGDGGERRAKVLSGLANVHTVRAELTEAYALQREALDIRRKINDRLGMVGSLWFLGATAPDFAGSRIHLGEALELAERLGHGRVLCGILIAQAQLEVVEGHLAEARLALDRAAAISRTLEDPSHKSTLLEVRAQIQCSEKDADGARESAAESFELARAFGDSYKMVVALNVLAVASWNAGRGESAAVYLAAAERLCRETGVALPPRRLALLRDAMPGYPESLAQERFEQASKIGREAPLDELLSLGEAAGSP